MSMTSQHWYDKQGKPCHTQNCKPGAKNPTRATDIRDAKRLGLLPSVSGITAMIANPGLDRYKQMRVAEEAFACPISGDETKDDYCRHLLDKAGKPAKEAADIGTELHKLMEAWSRGDPIDMDATLTFPTTGQIVPVGDVIRPAIAKVKELGLHPKGSEVVVVSKKHGYAGTTDMPWVRGDSYGILDYKGKKTVKDDPVFVPDTYPVQLAAYVAAYWDEGTDYPIGDRAIAYNLFMSTTEPGRVEVVEYNAERLRKEWEAFKAALTLWRWKNGYDPRAT